MTLPTPEVYVTQTGSFVSIKFVYPDEHVAYVHLTADEAQVLGAALQMRAAEVKPELVGP